LTRLAFALSATLVTATASWGQFSPDREVEMARNSYDLGKFAEALQRAQTAIGLSNFSADQRLTLHRVAGLAAFNLGELKTAKTHFLQLLQLDPDHQLDPFAVAPVAIKLFEQVRKENAEALNLVRQLLALKAEQTKVERAEQERLKREEQDRRLKLDELTRTVTVRTVEKRSLWLNFLPFGAGQLAQGRTEWGVVFALSEAILAITSVISYFAINSLYERYTLVLTDRTTKDFTLSGLGIPLARRGQYQVWTQLKFATGIAFYALWAVGAGEALWHHQSEVITETKEPLEGPPKASLQIFPTPGGFGAGITVGF
jgi:tetratricopeptide (TPR) repeat protein